jgi:ribonuclease P protein component
MRRSSDFASVVRTGARSRSDALVVHQSRDLGSHAPLVGFVVSKNVGGSVQRHRVARRLRAQVAQRLDAFPVGSGTVVRALPQAALLSSAELGCGLDRALVRLAERR